MTTAKFQRGVLLDEATLHPQDLQLDALWQTATNWERYDHTTPDELLQRCQSADLLISNKVELHGELLRQLPRLRLICIAATGSNNVDLEAAAELNIPVCNVTAYATPSVSEHVFSLILALRRRLTEHQRAASQEWPQTTAFCVLDYPMRELKGQTLGIIGCGELGKAVTRIARAFDMEVIISRRPGATNDHRPDRLPLKTVLKRSDIVSLHCPLTPSTHNLFNADALKLMKPDALLINTARGGIVDELALLDALQNNRLGGAALDVLEQEPPNAEHPLLTSNLPNLIITPHVAWASQEARQRLVDELVENIQAFLRDEERNRVV